MEMLTRSSLFIIRFLIKQLLQCLYSDGAAALVLVSGEKALQLGLHVIARLVGCGDAAQVGSPVICLF